MNLNATEIADDLIHNMGLCNGCDFSCTAETRTELAVAVERMLKAGCLFDEETVTVMVDEDLAFRRSEFGHYDGYDELDRILDKIFNGVV